MGIDLGSTSLKAVVYDIRGRVLASGSRPTELHHPDPSSHPGWAVWRPEQIWGGVSEAVRDAMDVLDPDCTVRGVAVTGMGMDGLPVDETGAWLYPLISWHDTRTMPQYEAWQSAVGAERTFAIGGNTLWYFGTAFRIQWMQEHEPELLKRAAKWLLIEDFVNAQLCGRQATDYSMASCTLLFDQRKLDWSGELLALAGIPRELMCDALPSGTVLGEVHGEAAKVTGLPAGTPVVLGGHDYLCGALPVGGYKPGIVLDVTGTWEIVLTAAPTPTLTPEVQRTGMTVEAHVARDTYAAWGGAVAAGMMEWYLAQFGGEAQRRADAEGGSPWDYLIPEAAAAPAGAQGALFLPHMSAAGCPVVDASSRGAFIGLTDRTTRGDVLRAIIEGLDYQFLDIVNAMEGALGQSADRIIAVGGAIRNQVWMQNKADVVGRPIEVPDIEGATPLGAAILAGIGVGIYRDEDAALEAVWTPGTCYEPDPERHRIYAERFALYRELYPSLKAVHHRLAALG